MKDGLINIYVPEKETSKLALVPRVGLVIVTSKNVQSQPGLQQFKFTLLSTPEPHTEKVR